MLEQLIIACSPQHDNEGLHAKLIPQAAFIGMHTYLWDLNICHTEDDLFVMCLDLRAKEKFVSTLCLNFMPQSDILYKFGMKQAP